MVRKCRGVAEVAVMEVDVRNSTTGPPPDFDHVAASSNKRKITAGELGFSTTSFVRLRSRRRRFLLPDNNLVMTASPSERSSTAPPSDHDASANGCSEVVEDSFKFVDLEDEKDEHGVPYKSSRERRETTPSSQFRSAQSDDMESPAGKSEATSGERSFSSVKMPTESELEEFFIVAEKNIQKRFAEKYNYDIVEDVPLEGRYEWIRLKP